MIHLHIRQVEQLGCEVIRWRLASCEAIFGVNEEQKWSTLYHIQSKDRGKGHASLLLAIAKDFYEAGGFTFGGTVALNDTMSRIYKRLNITEYNED